MNKSNKRAPIAASIVSNLRAVLLVILLLGLLGTGAELLLLNHTERLAQWVPLVLIALSLVLIVWHRNSPGCANLRAFQCVMIAFLCAGVAGFYFHYQGSVEFKLESNPTLSGWPLFWAAMRSKAPPPLAPGVMIQLGLLGLAYTYKHPALSDLTKQRMKEEE